MQKNANLSLTDDTILINSISHSVYQVIFHAYQQYPNWITKKFSTSPWKSSNLKTKIISNLAEELCQTENRDELIGKLISILQNLFLPTFFVSPYFTDLMANIRQYTHPELVNQINTFQGEDKLIQESQSKTAILLLDAENLSLDIEIEKSLQAFCNYPIKIKFAFANWCSLGKKDIEFHERGFDLIHVPAGKNSADQKMINFGASIPSHYPSVKEVLVCSSDKDLNLLSQGLIEQGLSVYRVSRKEDNILIANNQTGQTKAYSLKTLKTIPSLEEFIIRLKDIIREEQKQRNISWIKLSTLSSLFQSKYNLSISYVVTYHLPGKRARDIFLDFKTEFVVHQVTKESELFITLFDLEINDFQENLEVSQPENNSNQSQSEKINSQDKLDKLEKAIAHIIMTLNQESNQQDISISDVGIIFKKQYQISINDALKSLKISGKYNQFLENSRLFNLYKKGNINYVNLVSIIENHELISLSSKDDMIGSITQIIASSAKQLNQEYVPITNVATQFNQKHKISIKKVLKDLKITGKFFGFLKSCNNFKLKKEGTIDYVALGKL